jgi:hypothetical protein
MRAEEAAMTTQTLSAPTARARLAPVAGWTLTVLVVLFLAMDSAMKLADMSFVRAASTQLGFPLALDRLIGAIELVCLALYAIPRTAVLGAVLTTGLLGGAVAAHLRLADPVFTHTLFGVYVGVMAWGGLWLRDARLRALLPIVR